MQDNYKSERISISVDCVVFRYDAATGSVLALIVERVSVPKGQSRIALPGDVVHRKEILRTAAERVLRDQMNLGVPLYRFGSFEDPNRLNAESSDGDQFDHVISKGYFGFTGETHIEVGNTIDKTYFVSKEEIPTKMLYDHRTILLSGFRALQNCAQAFLLPLNGLPLEFTITDVQTFYESVLGRSLDKRNFRRSLMALDYLTETGALRKDVSHRPAKLYSFNSERFNAAMKTWSDRLPAVPF